ncbi:uncharacterized protein LOC135501001 [Lineus longissimus]|uniref:uncharacterized protein LOC135501001 n=1 Tax=Lineus longissimus TaxID=88925 RepID=UPI002B4C54DB
MTIYINVLSSLLILLFPEARTEIVPHKYLRPWEAVTMFGSNTTDSGKVTQSRPLPVLPKQFQSDWLLYNHPVWAERPPYDPLPPAPYEVGRGFSYYDHTVPGLVEEFYDFCLPIFATDYHWPCTFWHRDETSYLMSPTWAPYGPCCIFQKPWKVPDRNFIRVARYNNTDVFNGKIIDWYVLKPAGYPYPFAYGFYWDNTGSGHIPGSFWFPGNVGWTLQNFSNFTDKIAKKRTFNLPKVCEGVSFCIFNP